MGTHNHFGGLPPSRTLQLSPDLLVRFRQPAAGMPLEVKSVDSLSGEPGRPVAVLASVGKKLPPGGAVRVGDWKLGLRQERELLACAEHPLKWAASETLVLEVRPLAKAGTAGLKSAGDKPTAIGFGPLKTSWPELDKHPQEAVFTDGRRALRLEVESGRVVMYWYHRSPGPVFGDLDKAFADGEADHAWVVLRRAKLTSGTWYAASPTPFVLGAP